MDVNKTKCNASVNKRYPGNRYEYLISVSYEITTPLDDQQRKLDLFALFKKGNQIIAEKQNNQSLVGPLFSPMNIPYQWFWSKKSVNIIENNTHMSKDHLMNIISYITPFPFNAYMYAEFDTSNDKVYRICTLGECKIYRESSDDSSKRHLIQNNPYSSYYLFKLPPGKRLVFSVENEFSTPYNYKNEYDVDAQLEIKEIILFDVVDKTQKKCNPEQTFLYTNLEIDKKSISNTFTKSSNTCAKFRRPHILPSLPSYEEAPHIYEHMNISKKEYELYHERIIKEDTLGDNESNSIVVSFSIIGSSVYTIKFLNDALINLRRNLSHFNFNDKQFISEVINILVDKLTTFKH